MSEKKVGIELLKRFIKEAVELGLTTNEQLKDGFQWTDMWKIVGEGKDLTFVFSNWEAIKVEFLDLDEDEIANLVKEAVGDLGITKEEVVEFIDQLMEFAAASFELFQAFKKLKK